MILKHESLFATSAETNLYFNIHIRGTGVHIIGSCVAGASERKNERMGTALHFERFERLKSAIGEEESKWFASLKPVGPFHVQANTHSTWVNKEQRWISKRYQIDGSEPCYIFSMMLLEFNMPNIPNEFNMIFPPYWKLNSAQSSLHMLFQSGCTMKKKEKKKNLKLVYLIR